MTNGGLIQQLHDRWLEPARNGCLDSLGGQCNVWSTPGDRPHGMRVEGFERHPGFANDAQGPLATHHQCSEVVAGDSFDALVAYLQDFSTGQHHGQL